MLFFAFLLIGTAGPAKAETDKEVKLKGDCYYRYEYRKGEGRGIEITGIRKGAKNPHLPNRIDGKKVRWIHWDADLENGEKTIDTLTVPRYVENYTFITEVTDENGDANKRKTIRIKNYKVHAKNKYFSSRKGCLYRNKGETLKAYPDGRTEKSFTIPKGTTAIDEEAFIDSRVEKISMPNSVEFIANSAFEGSSLKSIRLSSNLDFIGESAFCKTDLQKIVLPKSLVMIDQRAFMFCRKLKSVTVPKKNHLYSIGYNAFWGCSRLRKFIYPEPEPIRPGAESYYLDNIKIESQAFGVCTRLEKVELPVGLACIGDSCFYNCEKLKEVLIKGETTIESDAFRGCESLQKVTLSNPKGRVCIGMFAFEGCKKLKKIRIASEEKEGDIDSTAFVGPRKKKKLTIIAPKNSYAYKYAKKYRRKGLKAKRLK